MVAPAVSCGKGTKVYELVFDLLVDDVKKRNAAVDFHMMVNLDWDALSCAVR